MIKEAYEAGIEAAMEKFSVTLGALGRGMYGRAMRSASPEAKGILRGLRKHKPDFQASLKSKNSALGEIGGELPNVMNFSSSLKGQQNLSWPQIKQIGKQSLV